MLVVKPVQNGRDLLPYSAIYVVNAPLSESGSANKVRCSYIDPYT